MIGDRGKHLAWSLREAEFQAQRASAKLLRARDRDRSTLMKRVVRWSEIADQLRCELATMPATGPDDAVDTVIARDVTDPAEFVRYWGPRCRGWMVALTDHNLIHDWQAAYEAVDRYAFAPIIAIERHAATRGTVGGPSSDGITWVMVARPKILSRWGTLSGAYAPIASTADLISRLTRDYSRPGDAVAVLTGRAA